MEKVKRGKRSEKDERSDGDEGESKSLSGSQRWMDGWMDVRVFVLFVFVFMLKQKQVGPSHFLSSSCSTSS